MASDFARSSSNEFNSDTLQTLRNLQDIVHFRINTSLKSSLQILETLRRFNKTIYETGACSNVAFESTKKSFESYGYRLQTQLENGQIMHQRVEASIGLVCSELSNMFAVLKLIGRSCQVCWIYEAKSWQKRPMAICLNSQKKGWMITPLSK